MNPVRRVMTLIALPLAFVALGGVSQCSHGGDDDDATAGTLQWYYTCGDPVCSGYTPKEGIPLCTDEQAGDPCKQEGQQCDPKDDCNRLLVCATEDPTQGEGGCPISRREYKKEVDYLSAQDLQRYHDEVLLTRLATYQYKNAPASSPRRLGFIINDQPESASVLPSHERVDLYGYTSMTVAAVQVQAKEIEALKAEVQQLKKELEAGKAKCR